MRPRKVLIFATSRADAMDLCVRLGVPFDTVTWVMNYQLLGGLDYAGHEVHYTDMFTEMPAYAEAWAELGHGASPVT